MFRAPDVCYMPKTRKGEDKPDVCAMPKPKPFDPLEPRKSFMPRGGK